MMLNKKIRTLAIMVFTLVLSFSAKGQLNTYHYKRNLKGVSEKWQSFALPSELFGKVQGDLSDLRIYGNKGKDTIEVPFFIKDNAEKKTEKEVNYKFINQVAGKDGHFITLVPETNSTINKIDLQIGDENFDWIVKLEGSNDNANWYTLLDKYRITAIKNQSISYRFTTLNFNDAQYKYYRIFFNSKEQPKFESAKISQLQTLNEKSVNSKITSFKLVNDPKTKSTTIDVTLKNAVPIVKIAVNVSSDIDYYRPIKIECVTDSFKTSNKLHYNYALLHEGFLTSVEKPEFSFKGPFTDKIKITIENYDNQPLSIKNIEVKEAQYELTARFGNADYQYALYYGNNKANAPIYDLENFNNKIPLTAVQATLENEKKNPDLLIKADSSLVKNPYWLWALVAIAVAILGYFAVKMLRE